jgi:hypothetical protein
MEARVKAIEDLMNPQIQAVSMSVKELLSQGLDLRQKKAEKK